MIALSDRQIFLSI